MFFSNYKYLYFGNYVGQGCRFFACFSLFLTLGSKTVQAQSITTDGSTNTSIEQTLNQYNIGGGENAGNNIFHSFEQFGLTQGEIVNFLSGLDTENIFGRVTGGDASVINGLLKITGGNPNLFFINPSGIIFGENSSINVPASFTATTAHEPKHREAKAAFVQFFAIRDRSDLSESDNCHIENLSDNHHL